MATTVGLLHPGEMGSVVGACLRAGGVRVVWPSAGRSEASRQRARAADLEDLGTLAAVVAASDVILSVCPPGSATDVARLVAAQRFGGLYVDANAVAPATARRVGEIVGAAGAELVDGGIIGPPPREAGTTRLYLAGPRAGEIASLFKGSALEAVEMPGDVGTASALKMAYAAWTKGSSALLIAVRALAIREGVDEALRAEWERSQPGLGGALGVRRRRQREEGLAVRRRDGGDRGDVRGRGAAGRVPRGVRRRSTAVSTATRTRRRRRRSPRWPRRSAPRDGVGAPRQPARASRCRRAGPRSRRGPAG